MAKYEIIVIETYTKKVSIEADSEKAATDKAWEMVFDAEIDIAKDFRDNRDIDDITWDAEIYAQNKVKK